MLQIIYILILFPPDLYKPQVYSGFETLEECEYQGYYYDSQDVPSRCVQINLGEYYDK